MSKKNYITLLSVMSAFAVVVLHTNSCFWLFSKDRYWLTANIIEGVFYFAVPVFFMITGATLIDYQEKYSTKEFFKKRIKKAVIPFICWNLIALVYCILRNAISIQSVDIKYIFNGIMDNTFMGIYWFFIPLFCIYLSMPLFAAIQKEKKISIFKYLVATSLIFNFGFPFINSIFNLNLSLPIIISVSSEYMIYIFIGYLLDNIELSKSKRYIIYVLGIIGLLMHIIGTYKLSIDANSIVQTYKGYYNIPCILYSTSVYVFIKTASLKIKNFDLLNILSKYTFETYLMHWFVMELFVDITKVNTLNIFYRLLAPIPIVAICILITYILRKIPIIKNIVP